MRVPTNPEMVAAAAATYAPRAVPYFEDVGQAIRVFLSEVEGVNVLAVEGTHDPLGWALDFCALSVKDQQGLNHATLGWVHSGFYASAVTALTRVALVAQKGPFALTGHSLGGALALLLAGLLIDDGLTPVRVCAFAPPRVGGTTLIDVVSTTPTQCWRWGDDPVPLVPMRLLPLWPYRQFPLTSVGPPNSHTWLDDFDVRQHHITNYVNDVK